MPPPPTGRRFGVARRLVAVGAVALAPKCLLCVAGYAATVTGLRWFGPELCGAEPAAGRWIVMAGLAALGIAGAAVRDRWIRKGRRS
jgi:hypothetical protein